MRDYMKGLRQYVVAVTAGLEHTGTTFTETVTARNADEAREAMERKWSGAAIGEVVDVTAVRRRAS